MLRRLLTRADEAEFRLEGCVYSSEAIGKHVAELQASEVRRLIAQGMTPTEGLADLHSILPTYADRGADTCLVLRLFLCGGGTIWLHIARCSSAAARVP